MGCRGQARVQRIKCGYRELARVQRDSWGVRDYLGYRGLAGVQRGDCQEGKSMEPSLSRS